MTRLQKHALGRPILTDDYIERVYTNATKVRSGADATIAMICESHERLRSEVQGAEIVMADYEREVKELKSALKSLCEYAAASRESNTKEFMQELGEKMDAAAIALKEPWKFILHGRIENGELWFTTRSIP